MTLTRHDIEQLAETTVAAIAQAATLAERRAAAKAEASIAMRAIEAALGKVLEHAGLSAFVGLPNLGTGSLYLRGLNVRRRNLDEPLPRGRADHTLVLDAKGKLVTALLVRTDGGPRGLHIMPATDDDLEPGDLGNVAAAAAALLRLHVLGAGERGELAERQEQLAENLRVAVAAWDKGLSVEVPR
jgi:hypothetical protein